MDDEQHMQEIEARLNATKFGQEQLKSDDGILAWKEAYEIMQAHAVPDIRFLLDKVRRLEQPMGHAMLEGGPVVPCPFCSNSTEFEFCDVVRDPSKGGETVLYFVACKGYGCFAGGPLRGDKLQARTAWNLRNTGRNAIKEDEE